MEGAKSSLYGETWKERDKINKTMFVKARDFDADLKVYVKNVRDLLQGKSLF